jgi:hypothetical protein
MHPMFVKLFLQTSEDDLLAANEAERAFLAEQIADHTHRA